ncbi:hypothetical protein ACNI5A_31160, partial [Klebsiella pneumoniae]|uniref:hypothetical protein n=1 Tax=Klebsiella pneumoniae TaxID=573 RepID=UPI003A883B34
MNEFAGTIDKVEGVNVWFKGTLVTNQNITGGGLISTGHANIGKGLAVQENGTFGIDLTVQRDIYGNRNMTVAG